MSLVELDKTLEKSAREVARKICKKQSEQLKEKQVSDFEAVDINSIETELPRSLATPTRDIYPDTGGAIRNAGKTLNINEMTTIKDNGKLEVKSIKIPHSA